jgi:hypothetical protein
MGNASPALHGAASSTTPWPRGNAALPFAQELVVAVDRARSARSQKKTVVGGFVKDFAQHGD